jgi:hypothetical protein
MGTVVPIFSILRTCRDAENEVRLLLSNFGLLLRLGFNQIELTCYSLMAKCEQKHEMSYKTADVFPCPMAKTAELEEICFKTATFSLSLMTKCVAGDQCPGS